MGAEIYGRGGDSFAPLVIRGARLHGIEYKLPIPSAQVKSAILLAGLFAEGDTVIEQPLPSRDHTERLLELMGARVRFDSGRIHLAPLVSPLKAIDITVPGDISSAAYWIVAGIIHSNARIKIKGCGVNPLRTGILDALTAMGARIKFENQRLESNELVADLIVESSQLRGIEISGEIVPRLIDEIPLLALAGCVARGTTVIRNASELRTKESDRITATVRELSRLGARIDELPDGMVIHGGSLLTGAEVKSHGDHRLAMTLAVAGLVAKGVIVIHNAEVTEISYPGFWQELENISMSSE
jgi:3-phosphoshikimate 1-carboxyvinyltransferase